MIQNLPSPNLETVFRSQVESVFGYLLLRSGSRPVAEDLTSQTFVAASERFASGRGHEVSPAWLQTVASRRLIDHWRNRGAQERRFRRLASIPQRQVEPPVEPPDDVLEALDSLPERQRAVLVLRYLDDFSNSEISEALGVSYKATESLLARARASFSAAYKGADDAE